MKPRILIIDDDKAIQATLRDILQEEGYEVDISPSGKNGIQRLKRNRYCAALIDIRLPDISGLSILKKAAETGHNICLIIITAYPELDTAVSALRSGAFDYIQKPFNIEEVKFTVKRGIENTRLIAENKRLLQQLKEEKQRHSEALRKGAELTGTSAVLEEYLENILEVTKRLAQVDTCSIMLIDENTKKIKIKAACGITKDIIDNTAIDIGEGISGWVVKNKKPLFIEDIEKDSRFSRRNSEKYITKSLISLPLMVKDKVIGVLNVNNKMSGMPFTKEDLPVLSAISAKISLIVDNSRMYGELLEKNRELGELQEELYHSGRLATLGEVASITAHEINTPLTTIKGFMDMLPGKLDDEDFRNRFTKTMKREIERIVSITGRLLGFAHKTKPSLKKIDINRALEDALLFLEYSLNKTGITVKKNLMPQCPPVTADKNQMEQVFLNIITNAAHAMRGAGTLAVKTDIFNIKKCNPAEHSPQFKDIMLVYGIPEWLEVSISDTGCGIPEENIKNLFKPFFTTKEKGTGLGLSICRRIISQHDGILDVKSVPGKGSIFYIYLPLKNINIR